MKAQPPIISSNSESPVARFARADDPDWHWLEDRDDPEVKRFLDAANAQSEQALKTLEPLM